MYKRQEYLWAAVALAVGALTLYSMLKIWLEAFWKPHPDGDWQPPVASLASPATLGLGALVLVTLWMGLFPETMIDYVNATAAGLKGGVP